MTDSITNTPTLYACFEIQDTNEEQWFFIKAGPSFFPNSKDEDEQDELEGIRDSNVWTFLTDEGYELEQGYVETEKPVLPAGTEIYELSIPKSFQYLN